MNKYIYRDPVDDGYEKVKLSHVDFKYIFPNIKSHIGLKNIVFVEHNRKQVIIDTYVSFIGKIAIIIILPLTVVLYGINILEEVKDVLFYQQQKGKFIRDNGGKEYYESVMESKK
jgi:hypothetical protein